MQGAVLCWLQSARPNLATAPQLRLGQGHQPPNDIEVVRSQNVSKTPSKTAAKSASSEGAPAKKLSAKAQAEALASPPSPVASLPAQRPMNTIKPPRAASGPVSSTASFAERFSPPKQLAKSYPEPSMTVKSTAKVDPKLANAWKTKPGRELTPEELIAMPDDEYMNEQQLAYFRAVLQAEKEALLSNAGETTEHLREDTSIVPDPADRATIEEEHALELRTRDRERKLLKKISQSIVRIDAGDYGFCDETGEPIGLRRLMARPTATLSLEAQQRRELKQKMFGD
jgi:DnaK suppressor protein